jgi:serine/threonine protein phosphatase PrpC
MLCPACNVEQPIGNRFCEDCGTRLESASESGPSKVEACRQCGAAPEAIDADGFCGRCGHERVAPPRDHFEISAAPHLAAVSDRGKRHPHNEDFLGVFSSPAGDVLVVCDGVSSSQNAAEASRVAAEVVCAALREGLAGTDGADALFRSAFHAAQNAVAALPWTKTLANDPPETTIVAAVRRGRHVTIGWVGDSRAYLLTSGGGRLLTHDHSWVNEVVDAGKMTLAEALQAPQAHALTRSLGGPVEDDVPQLAAIDLPAGHGCLVLCTDGLWNCAPTPDRLGDVLRTRLNGAALAIAQALVTYAHNRSGHDNITAAVLTY